MFHFEKLIVYQKSKLLNATLHIWVISQRLLPEYRNQLLRAASSIMLNIAEGSGRTSAKERRRFFIISRGSAYEVAAILDLLHEVELLPHNEFRVFQGQTQEISKMLMKLAKVNTV